MVPLNTTRKDAGRYALLLFCFICGVILVSGELKHALALSALSRVFQIWALPFSQDFPPIL